MCSSKELTKTVKRTENKATGTMGSIHQKFARKKVGDTEKRAKHWVRSACSEMNVGRSFDRSFFSVQTSRVAGWLPFFPNRARVWHFQVAQKLCRSWWHEQKGKVNRQFLGRPEGSMVAEYTSSYTSLRDRQVPGSHRNRSTACQSETLPWITKDSGKR